MLQAQTFEQHVDKTLRLDYWLSLPDTYGATDQRWPLILFLHGAGERGSDIEQLKVNGIPKVVESRSDIPALVVAPQCPADSAWFLHIDALDALLKEVIATYDVDIKRIYLTGLSMGGCGTWHLAATYPERFAAIAPICGWGEWFAGFPDKANVLKDVPTWAFHGAKDDIVPLEGSSRLVDVLKAAGGNVRFTVYPDAKHDSWSAAYDDPELYRWMFAQSLP